MPAASRSSPHSWGGLGLLIAVALPAFACNPPQAVDRSSMSSGVDVGGAMRSGNMPSTPAPSTPGGTNSTPGDPPKTPTSIDPTTPAPGTGSDAGTNDPSPSTPTPTPTPDPQPTPIDDGGIATPTPAPIPTADAGVPSNTPDPTLSTMMASDCKNLKEWVVDSGPYLGGEKVTYGTPKRKFECRPWPFAPWCAQLEYEPGKNGLPWVDAWIDRGICP